MDDLEQLIRSANPSPVKRDSPLTGRAERELQALVEKPQQVTRSRRTRGWWALGLTAAAMALTAVIVPNLLATQPRVASGLMTPPLLVATPIAEPIGWTLERLGSLAREDKVTPSSATIALETWSAPESTTATSTAFVQPNEIIRSRLEDLSGSIVRYAGEVRWGFASHDDITPPGTELTRHDYAQGKFPLRFSTQPPSDPFDLSAYLIGRQDPFADLTSTELFLAIRELRNDWALSGGQTAAVLNLIGEFPDVETLGEVIDRLGRPGIAIATDSHTSNSTRSVLVFDSESGRLLSAETILIGPSARFTVDPPAVIDYVAWKENG